MTLVDGHIVTVTHGQFVELLRQAAEPPEPRISID
jgi:hypothetical protein